MKTLGMVIFRYHSIQTVSASRPPTRQPGISMHQKTSSSEKKGSIWSLKYSGMFINKLVFSAGLVFFLSCYICSLPLLFKTFLVTVKTTSKTTIHFLLIYKLFTFAVASIQSTLHCGFCFRFLAGN